MELEVVPFHHPHRNVGEMSSAEGIPKTDKLLLLSVDSGEKILSEITL